MKSGTLLVLFSNRELPSRLAFLICLAGIGRTRLSFSLKSQIYLIYLFFQAQTMLMMQLAAGSIIQTSRQLKTDPTSYACTPNLTLVFSSGPQLLTRCGHCVHKPSKTLSFRNCSEHAQILVMFTMFLGDEKGFAANLRSSTWLMSKDAKIGMHLR